MMKWLMCAVLAVLVGGSWIMYSKSGDEIKRIDAEIERIEMSDDGDIDELVPGLESKKQSIEGEQTFNGILLAFLTSGLLGILFVTVVLPLLAQRATHAVYDSAEMVEKDPMHDARSFVAQGEFEKAIEAFKMAATQDPLNRLPWVEIAKIQRDHLENPAAAIETLTTALEGQEWQVNDAAYLLFRIAELYDEEKGDRTSAATILQQVIDMFPETRHSANARHKLHEWGLM